MTSFDYKYQNALRQAIVFSFFFFSEESLVRETNLHYRGCSEMHSGSFSQCIYTISFPEPANFLRRMLDENEGSGKDQFLGDPDWLSEMQYDTISPLFADF